MIQLPRRSVTRFFIPLIDVLTLLFCIFLVLPLAKDPGGAPSGDVAELQEQLRRDEDELKRLRAENEQLRQAGGKALEKRLWVRVLEVDGDDGRLYYRDPNRIPLDEDAAHRLVESDRRNRTGKELYYLILYPRNPESAYPTLGQREAYERWFAGVALGYDDPSDSAGGTQR